MRKLPDWMLNKTACNNTSHTNNAERTLPLYDVFSVFTNESSPDRDINTIEQDNFSEEPSTTSTSTVEIPEVNIEHPEIIALPLTNNSNIHRAAESEVSSNNNNKNNSNVHAVAGPSSNISTLLTKIKVEIKSEPIDENAASSSTNVTTDNKLNIKKEFADSSTSPLRVSCSYGIRCYRHNLEHRSSFAHPGDQDYRRPTFPSPPLGTADCPYGANCYRRNPVHFQQFNHPSIYNPNIVPVNPNNNRRKFKKDDSLSPKASKRRRKMINNPVDYGGDSDEYDLEDPFLNDNSSDEYDPNNDDDESDTDPLGILNM